MSFFLLNLSDLNMKKLKFNFILPGGIEILSEIGFGQLKPIHGLYDLDICERAT